jgi:hypothetical protein
MLRNERPRLTEDGASDGPREFRLQAPPSKDLFIGEPAALKGHAYAISGWPSWLIPAYQLKAHKPTIITLLQDER